MGKSFRLVPSATLFSFFKLFSKFLIIETHIHSCLQGVYDRISKQVHLFVRGDRRKKIKASVVDAHDPELEEIIGKTHFAQLMEDIEVLDSLMPEPDIELIAVSFHLSALIFVRFTRFFLILIIITVRRSKSNILRISHDKLWCGIISQNIS